MEEDFEGVDVQEQQMAPDPEKKKSQMIREEYDKSEPRKALVKRLTDKIKAGKKHHKDAFSRIHQDMQLARDGYDKKDGNPAHYIANVVQQHIKMRTSALYAKNPKAVAKRRERMDFEIWDGDMETIMLAQQNMAIAQQSMMPPNPMDMKLLQDYQQGSQLRDQLDRISKTLEVLFHYSMQEQIPSFKTMMKQLVRRAVVTGAGYIKIGFQRELEKRPDVVAQIADVTQRIAQIERLSADLADGEIEYDSAEAEELALSLEKLQSEPELIVREGLLYDFPRTTSIIIDPACVHLSGFVGANWIAEEYLMTVDDVKETYGVDVATSYTAYKPKSAGTFRQHMAGEDTAKDSKVQVWELYDKKSGLMYVIADGYCDFLKEPGGPNVDVEQFFPFFPLSFNDTEDDEQLIPPSDVRLMRDMQLEYNRSRQGLREHRIANRPRYVLAGGTFEDADKDLLKSGQPHEVLELQGLADGQKVQDVLTGVPTVGIDPNLYETSYLFEDMQRVVGSDSTSFGQANGQTATANALAEGSRSSSTGSNVDDLDDMFTQVARASGQILMLEMDVETVKKIVGPGAVWPDMRREETAEEIYLEIEAGSSGRPNRELEMANMERILPFLIQMPTINPKWLAETTLKRMDDHLDLTDAVIDGLASITAQNGMQQPGTGDPSTDPNAQGGEGADNGPKGEGSQQGPQPGMRSV